MGRILTATSPSPISSAFTVGEPGTKGGDDIMPSAFFTLLGGADVVYGGLEATMRRVTSFGEHPASGGQ